jgi:NAD(P)-dependent dehydrogenase (short-subunit alcohol dehydrogenase family)
MGDSYFAGTVAMVVGGTSGIGRRTALLLAERGARVAIVGRRRDEGAAVAAEIERTAAGAGIFLEGDVSSDTSCRDATEQVLQAFGALHMAVNSAGVMHPWHLLAELPTETFDEVISVNLRGTFVAMKYQIPAMLVSGGGAIVNVSSVAGLGGITSNVCAYAASKHGVVGLTKAAALDYAKAGIRINVICPGAVETPMVEHWTAEERAGVTALHPMGRMASPEEIAETIVFLLSPGAGYITGAAISVDGGVVAQ